MLLSKLENNFVLLTQVCVVWIDQHKLVIICHVVILINILVLFDDIEFNRIFLDKELWVLMNEERCQVVMLPLTVIIWIIQVADML